MNVTESALKGEGLKRRDKRLLTTEEAAEYLCVSVRTVKNLISEGRLAYVEIGRSTRLDQRDLDDFVGQNRRKQRHPLRNVS